MSLQKYIAAVIFSILFVLTLSSCGTQGAKSDRPGLDLSKDYEKIQTSLSYKNLATLDLDQVNDLVQAKLNEYTKQNNIQSLREAAMIVFSRPDDDALIEKVLSNVRNPLEEEGQWQPTIESLVRQSVDNLKNSDIKQAEQVTSGIILENIIAEFKPAFIKQYKIGGFETNIIDYIADSGVNYSKEASKERSLYLMRNNLNPSQIASKIQAAKNVALEKEEKETKKLKK